MAFMQGDLWRLFRWVMWGGAALLLALPLVAMQFTSEVNWTASDFVVMGAMLGIAAGTVELNSPGLTAEAWWGVFAPARTPPEAIARFNAALRETFREERLARQMTETQQARLVLSSPEELRGFFAGQVASCLQDCWFVHQN